MAHSHESFIPAAGRDWLLPLYDPLNRLVGAEKLKRSLVAQAGILPGHRVLDIGCGTGSVTLLLKSLHPEAEVVGLDPDPKALAQADRKARQAGLEVQLDEGFSNELPYPDACFDRATSSLMLHHLDPVVKRATLRELSRVLKPGASLHVLDFGPPRSRFASFLTGLMHRGEEIRDNLEGRIPTLMQDAGFQSAKEVAHRNTAFGTLSFYRATSI